MRLVGLCLVVVLAVTFLPAATRAENAIGWSQEHVTALLEQDGLSNLSSGSHAYSKPSKMMKKKMMSTKMSKQTAQKEAGKKKSKKDKKKSKQKEKDQGHYQEEEESYECDNGSVAVAPATICVEWIPGIGYSDGCDTEDTQEQGGGVCNLVSKAWLSLLGETHKVDLVLNHAGLCANDIVEGTLTFEALESVLPHEYQIVLVKMSGAELLQALQQAADSAFESEPQAYPYGSGIRFKVDYTKRNKTDFVYDVEVNTRLEEDWHAINLQNAYQVATNQFVAESGLVLQGNVEVLDYTDSELFFEYATTECVLEDPPLEEYSTQAFDGFDKLLGRSYYCLEDNMLCDDECGDFCDY